MAREVDPVIQLRLSRRRRDKKRKLSKLIYGVDIRGMKFLCVKEKLEKALVAAERFTGKNTTLPILGNILLEDKKNSLCLSATNLECAIQINIPGIGKGEGKLSVPAKIMSSFIQACKDEKIELEDHCGNLVIKTNSRDTKINGISSDDFPLVPKVNSVSSFLVEGSILAESLEKVLPAVSLSDFKPELGGVFFKSSVNSISLAATDTFRLAEQVVPIKKYEGEVLSFIVPYRIASEVVRVFMGEDEVSVSIGENQIVFEAGGVMVTSRLIDGNFPDYQQIIPRSFGTAVYLAVKEFIDAIRVSSIFASKLQDVTLSFHENMLNISSKNQEIGEYNTAIPVNMNGKDITLSVNYRYLLDGLHTIRGKELFWGCNNENSPILLRDKSDNSFLYIVMPIRVS